MPYDIDDRGPLSIVDLDPLNRQILVFHQGKACSLDALDAGLDRKMSISVR